MKAVPDHRADVVALSGALPVISERVTHARGLVLVQDLPSLLSIPRFDNSAMDGFAVRAADVRCGAPLPVRGESAAGQEKVKPLEPGTAMRILTGAPMPEGADAVLQLELTEEGSASMEGAAPARITPTAEVSSGTHVRHAGEDVMAGDTIFRAGTELTATHIAALIACGYGEVPVHKRPRVGVVTTGEELRPAGSSVAVGQIPDSNGPLVVQLIEERGGTAVHHLCASDTVATFRAEIARIAGEVDLIVTTGGVSAGAYDVVRETLTGVTFTKVAMQPGKPQGFGKILDANGRAVPVVCLPGNPVSVFVSTELFVLPLLDAMLGRHVPSYDEMFTAEIVDSGWHHKPGRAQFMPCTRATGGIVPAGPGGSASHLVGSLPLARGLARVEADATEVRAGDTLPVLWIYE
ncbi:MAG: molybdopterin molybdotransferase MoeA [Ancrocorticia sp.]|jgi:molybdopterin molybdotransferase|nr:molybdopterin molybdotransferase MoeA [Ancrocorticia sp.]MCI2029748.1 molybdopterin molybdotransferase MoeA [Ancrocorticia sp.]MCI2178559.1 molybdopterin molybdotransferase MoeA [Ancrocorticia sp.]MCI2194166.1 molybdopterin molybdotransferase MoeA [Ancrocorticia sp.]